MKASIKLGQVNNYEVTTDTSESFNGHTLMIGMPGAGKTVQAQNQMIQIARAGGTVIALDTRGSLSDDQIFPPLESLFKENLHDINAHTDGVQGDLFTPVKYPDGTVERAEDAVCSIVDILCGPMHFGSRQKNVLRMAVTKVFRNGTYATRGIRAVDDELAKMDTVIAMDVREKLSLLTSRNMFRPGNDMTIPGKINVIRLSKFDSNTQISFAETVCAYLWRMAMADKFKKTPVYLFIDECQNMPCGKNSMLAQMLSEGRRFGINLILATQFLENSSRSSVQERITQCGLILFFKPSVNKTDQTARVIDPANKSTWSEVLRGLKVGEFVAVGPTLLNGQKNECPLKVNGIITDSVTNHVDSSHGFTKFPELHVNGVVGH